MKCVYCGSDKIEKDDIETNDCSRLEFSDYGRLYVYVCKSCGYVMIFNESKDGRL